MKYEIGKNIGVISENSKGWCKELNLISWNGNESKYDIRECDLKHEKMGKGCTYTEEELINLRNILNDMELNNIRVNPLDGDVKEKKWTNVSVQLGVLQM